MNQINRLKKLLITEKNLLLKRSQIKQINGKLEMIKHLRNRCIIEFEWTLLYKITVSAVNKDGAISYVEGNLDINNLELETIKWNPNWQLID